MKEIWKPVKNYEGLYEVSNTGYVRSIDRTVIAKNGASKKLKGKELFFTISKVDKNNHLPRASVQLWKNNQSRLIYVHRLVAEAFIPNPDNKETVNHKDGNPLNNCVDNLEWASYSEQMYHAYKTGLTTVTKTMFPKNSTKVIANNPDTGEEIICDSASQLSRILNVSHTRISKCAKDNSKIALSKVKGFIVQYL